MSTAGDGRVRMACLWSCGRGGRGCGKARFFRVVAGRLDGSYSGVRGRFSQPAGAGAMPIMIFTGGVSALLQPPHGCQVPPPAAAHSMTGRNEIDHSIQDPRISDNKAVDALVSRAVACAHCTSLGRRQTLGRKRLSLPYESLPRVLHQTPRLGCAVVCDDTNSRLLAAKKCATMQRCLG